MFMVPRLSKVVKPVLQLVSAFHDKESNHMKLKFIMVALVLMLGSIVFAQDLTNDVGKGAKEAGKGTETVTKDVAHGTRDVAKDTAGATEKGTKDLGKGAEVVGKDTVKGTEKAIRDVGKGAEAVGKDTGKAVGKTAKKVVKRPGKEKTSPDKTKGADAKS
jgi:hypothetical protein